MAKIPINLKTGEAFRSNEIVVGIDLGTTNSLIASTIEGKPYILKNHCGEDLFVPTVVYLQENGSHVVGQEAKNKLILDPKHTIYSIKRLLGKSLKELPPEDQWPPYLNTNPILGLKPIIKIGNQEITPIEISSMVLKFLIEEAQKSTNSIIQKAVITVPAYFNNEQRQATLEAGRLANLEVLRIINEPTAASLAFGIGLDKQINSIVAVYDLGGGTFDITILRIENGIFDVLSTRGDSLLGGDDFDEAILNYWKEKYLLCPETNELAELREKAIEAKKLLTEQDICHFVWKHILLEISIDTFKTITQELISKTIECCKLAIKDSGIKKNEIDHVLMVGGATRMRIIRDSVSIFFEKELNTSMDPDYAVAYGAAIQADILSGKRSDLLLLDVNPLSLGIETLGGLMDVIIPRNSKIPLSLARNYTTSKDGQSSLKISIYQGERDLVIYNRLLGQFILNNIPPMPAGIPKIEVQFRIDADGILNVKAKELRSGTEQEILIKSQFNISAEEISKMLLNSVQNAASDMQQKALIDIKNEAHNVILHTDRFLHQNKEWLQPNDLDQLKNFIVDIKMQIDKNNKEGIENLLNSLNNFAGPLAHQAMDQTIHKALLGKKIENNA